MKNPIKYLKHIVKDPINTIEEADERKKELKPLLYVSIPLVLIGIGILGLLLYFFLCFIIKRAKERFAAMTCDGCNTVMQIKTEEEYQKYVSYKIGGFSHSFQYVKPQEWKDLTVRSSVRLNVVYECTCPNCGKKNYLKYQIKPLDVETEKASADGFVNFDDILKNRTIAALRPVAAFYRAHGLEPAEFKSKKVSVKPVGGAEVDFTLSDADIEMLKAGSTDLEVSCHSIHHKDYGKASIAVALYKKLDSYPNARLTYHRTVDEMAAGVFVRNELNGTMEKILDPQ